ncbi:hypothetical protein M422DRAFT_72048 [Sphaerobolus stellatus SS14]|uniref:Uncharacterized protein n=1 Tax=Sphaerobolus stellatus (strain SS14) TaxID=990650 RepID=A0A0C9T9P8_SPHS4|nr:hypothetical protein M422DRAFT_72048 [Sphaerobolus stellatus SS14]
MLYSLHWFVRTKGPLNAQMKPQWTAFMINSIPIVLTWIYLLLRKDKQGRKYVAYMTFFTVSLGISTVFLAVLTLNSEVANQLNPGDYYVTLGIIVMGLLVSILLGKELYEGRFRSPKTEGHLPTASGGISLPVQEAVENGGSS